MSTEQQALVVDALAEALKTEFAFVMGLGISADDEAWHKAAAGMVEKLGLRVQKSRKLVTESIALELKMIVTPQTERVQS